MRQGDSNQQSNYAGCLSNEPAYNYSPNVTTTNQITASPYTYDKAGNVLTAPFGSGTNTFTYDAENHLLTVNPGGITYTYDGDGKRIIKSTGTIYWYGNNAAPMAETTLSDSLLFRDFYFNSERVARQEINNWVDNFVYDHLGNTRYFLGNINAVGGTPYNNISDFFPFGGELIIQAPDPQPWKFTGKERDSESGLDNFDTRYFGSSMGRFMSPDPLGPGQHPGNPQSWNLYSYVQNNPLNLVDPTGQYVCASSVSQQQCDNFQNGLDQAQQAANALKEKYGADSDQYQSAQRAIDAYGKEGVDNGVTLAQGDTGNYAAETKVAGTTVAKTADNPTGQNILVTLNKNLNLLSGDNTNFVGILGAHEGSHVADASDWVASGFSNNANPSVRQSEFDAYRVGLNIAEGMGFSWTTVSFGNNTYRFNFPQSQPETNNAINLMITREYPKANLDVFSRNTKIKRPQ